MPVPQGCPGLCCGLRDGTQEAERSPANFCFKDDFSCPYHELEYLLF